MLQLIRLEWKKNGIKKYILGALIVTALLFIFMYAQCFLGIARDAATGVPDSAPGMEGIMAQIDLFTNLVFLIITATMLASFIVNAYQKKTMNLMFCYPIRRQKIILAQMFSVWIFNVIFLLAAKLIICAGISILGQSHVSDFTIDYNMNTFSFYLQILLKTVVTVTVGFIPLFVGKSLKSSKAVIITAFLLFFLMNGTIGEISLAGNFIAPLILVIISLVCAGCSIFRIEQQDI